MEDNSTNTTTNDALGPPPSYDSIMYGDAGRGEVPINSHVHPLPAQYPDAPYTYPVPPSYPVNPAYPGGFSQPPYPTAFSTTQPTRTAIIQPTIVRANQRPRSATSGCCKIILCIVSVVFVIIFVIVAWNLSSR